MSSVHRPEYMPPNSSNPHYFCPCEKQQYMGVDATRLLGFVALNLRRAKGYADNTLPAIYRPNHHFFYADRTVDVADGLPKWATVLEGAMLPERSSKSGSKMQQLPLLSAADIPLHSATASATVANNTIEWIGSSGSASCAGRVRKDVLPLSPVRPAEPSVYHFPETEWPANNHTKISGAKIAERVARKYNPSPGAYHPPVGRGKDNGKDGNATAAVGAKQTRDAIVIGGGHNGLVAAAYLAKSGMDVLVLERRHIVGGAAVTEEIVPGFKFSRASYLAGLLRPQIIRDLQLERFGFKYLPRDPSSFTPTLASSPYHGKYLVLGENEAANHASISQFSAKDAEAYPRYEAFLGKVRDIMQPLLDNPLPSLNPLGAGLSWKDRVASVKVLSQLVRAALKHKEVLVPFYELFTGPAQQILDRWFESEILKTTLATDAVVGALVSLKQNGSAYVLLHHVMGEAAGKKGVWSYVQGGMGAISNAIAASARSHGAEIVTNATVKRILYEKEQVKGGGGYRVSGVEMEDGSVIHANVVLAGCTPFHTFLELLPGLAKVSGMDPDAESPIPDDFTHHIRFADYSCGAFKINCAVDKLPNFACYPSPADGTPGPMHKGTIHFECLMEELENAYREASMNMPASRPVVEMTIPSAVDSTIAPPGKHVVQLFVQFAPYDVDPKVGSWADEAFKNQFADRIFRVVEEFCPGFSASVIGRDVLSPMDLERIFGLHRGQICHGSLSLHQLAYARPMSGFSDHRSPLKGLYMCGAGTHPGGGVQGAPGKNCAEIVLRDVGK